MAVKFPLEMKNGVMVRNIDELKENFDIEKVVGYFIDGKLLTWLEARYYEEETEAVSVLEKTDSDLAKKLCEIFGVEYVPDVINTEEIEKRNEKIALLKQYTQDREILNMVDAVAFNQEELAELYDKGLTKIYLCAGKFKIPKSKQNLEYHEIADCVVDGLPIKKLESMEVEEPILEDEVIPENHNTKEIVMVMQLGGWTR